MNVYMICTGNTCRSPMAEAILRAKQLPHVQVKSAGVLAVDGMPISDHAKTILEEADMLYTPYSKRVTKEDLEWAQLILTMTIAHKDMLIQSYPEVAAKTFTLKEYAFPDQLGDIHDPFGGDLTTYRRTFEELQTYLDIIEQKLQNNS